MCFSKKTVVKRDEVYNDVLHNLYSSLIYKKRWVGYVAHMGEKGSDDSTLAGKH
jgi:hypothetical protein